MKKLYKFYVDCRRQGSLDGLFVADDAEVATLIGKEVYFGEVLGKHSEVIVTIDESEVVPLTDDQDFIEKFERFRCASGFNPFDYLERE